LHTSDQSNFHRLASFRNFLNSLELALLRHQL